MKIPSIITQGDTATWRDDATTDNLGNAITSAGYTLTWYFSGPTVFNVSSAAYSSGWETTLSIAMTAAMTAATDPSTPNYFWQATAGNGSVKHTIGTGQITILKNLASSVAGYDGRTQAEQDLAAVRAAITARVSGGMVAEYAIGSRRLRNEPVEALLALESRLKLMVSKERAAQSIANGLGDPRNTFVRFTNYE